MVNQEYDNAIGSFLRSLLPPAIEQNYRILLSLEYPIPDLRTFKERLEQSKLNYEDIRQMTSLFEPEDFGIDTAQSALEKFNKRSLHLSLPGVPLSTPGLQLLASAVSSGGLSFRGTDLVLKSRAGGAIEVDCVCEQGGGGCAIDVFGNVVKCRSSGCESGCGLVVTIPTDQLGDVVRF